MDPQCETDLIRSVAETEKPRNGQTLGVPVQVMASGPCGECSVDPGEYESVLLFNGGWVLR